MISNKFLANIIEKQLNLNSQGLDFLIYADEGEIEKGKTNGKIEVISNGLSPFKNIVFETINVRLTILVDLHKSGWVKVGDNEREQSLELLKVYESVDEMIKAWNGNTLAIIGEDGITYNTTITVGRATDGVKQGIGFIPECLPIYVSIGFSFFQNGANTNDFNISINGEELYYTDITFSNQKTIDNDEFANEEETRANTLATGLSIDLVIPATTNKVSRMVMEDILNKRPNYAMAVEVNTPIGSDLFIAIFGNTTTSGKIGSNAGQNISLVKAKEDLVKYSDVDGWHIMMANRGTTMTLPFIKKGIIFWGDGTSEIVNNAGATHTFEIDATIRYLVLEA